MTFTGQLRLSALVPSAAIGCLLFLSACATSAPRPPAPIQSGQPRVDPSAELPTEEIESVKVEPTEEVEEPSDMAEAVLPPHMFGRDVTRAAVLLPFSHPNANVRKEAEGMLAGIEMGLFDHADENFVILPKDTAGTQSRAESAAREAIEEGADVVLGPLFAANVQVVSRVTSEEDVPVLAFSNDRRAAGTGAFLASVSPEEEVARIIAFARQRGIESFAFLGPDNGYGRRIETALRFEASRNGGQVIDAAFYDPSNDAPTDQAQRIASIVQSEAARIPGRVAVMVPERGVKLRAVAPLLPYFGVDTRYVVFLGTSQWNDASVWREPTLIGGFFPAAPPQDSERFDRDYRRIYGRAPTGLASLGYDAAALSAALANVENGYDRRILTNSDGFMGVNGLFRFRSDGTAERGLAVMEITSSEGAVIAEPGRTDFTGDGS